MESPLSKEIHRAIPKFVFFTILGSWLCWLPPLLNSVGLLSNLVTSDLFLLLGTFIPSILGIVFIFIENGKNGFKVLRKKIFAFHFKKVWWIYLIFLMPAITAISFYISSLFEETELTFFMGNPIYLLPIFFIVILFQFGPLGEEIGWRGYLLPSLFRKYSIFWSTIFLGISWSLWHLPLFFIEGTIQSSLEIWQFSLFTILLSFLYSILFVNTGESVGAAIFFHTIGNLSHSLFPALFTEAGILTIGIVMICVVSIIIIKNQDRVFGR